MRDTYQEVTDRIVAMLESGTKPWQKSWGTGGTIAAPMARPLRSNGAPYRGLNVINLWSAAMLRGFNSRYWLTYKGAQALGGQVTKGARAELAFYVGKVVKAGENDGDEDRIISFMKSYAVFNADQIEGLPAHFYAAAPVEAPVVDGHARIDRVDAFVDNLAPKLAHGGDRAYYMPSTDSIRMPHMAQFDTAQSYYATLLHEMVHWTSADARVDRKLTGRFGDPAYAFEELIAEIGAAFLCADLAISDTPRADHASYLASWLKVLKEDKRAIFRAAALADKAATWMHAAQPDNGEAAEAEMELAA